MTATNFAACINFVLHQNEKGFNANEGDGAGATNWGVNQKNYGNWLGRPVTVADIQALTPADVVPYYRAAYWRACAGDHLPTGVDLMVLDEGINEGPGVANRHLQEALGVSVDGLIGPQTLTAALAANASNLITQLAKTRQTYYEGLPGFVVDGHGWTARVARTEGAALAMLA